MIYSMTAFARVERQGDFGSLVCEIRSINHRYLEAGLHLPEVLRVLEMPMRDMIKQYIKRGKIECVLKYLANKRKANVSLTVNTTLAHELCLAAETIGELLHQPASINTTDILYYPGVIETKEADLNELQTEVLQLLEKTLDDLVGARAREGKELAQLFLLRMDAMQQELVKVRSRLPQVLIDQRERLLKRFADAKIELDPTRLEQEMVILAQKMDIAEEIERTETHITEIRRILQEGGMVGRRLDFLLQELNREANTLGSKSTDSVLTHAAVEMKVLIEQVREQVQNVE